MTHRTVKISACCLVLCLAPMLSSCGNKGPLTLPSAATPAQAKKSADKSTDNISPSAGKSADKPE